MTSDSGTVYRALQTRARTRRLNTQQQLELYVHERLLARVAASAFADQLVLKGGMLLAALDIREVTRDADLAATAIDNDAITITTMREDDEYYGLRIKLPCALLTYSVEALLAEKIVTMISRGDANTRDRDFGDVWLIGQQIDVAAQPLIDDMCRTAEHRAVDLRPLAVVLDDIRKARQASWRRYRTRTGITLLPALFDEVLDFGIAFADPLLRGDVTDGTWSTEAQAWNNAGN